jgi:hypothetical protein
MSNVKTIWDLQGKKLGKSPIDKYSFTKRTSQDDSTERNLRKDLDEALNYGEELLNQCEKNESDLQKKRRTYFNYH